MSDPIRRATPHGRPADCPARGGTRALRPGRPGPPVAPRARAGPHPHAPRAARTGLASPAPAAEPESCARACRAQAQRRAVELAKHTMAVLLASHDLLCQSVRHSSQPPMHPIIPLKSGTAYARTHTALMRFQLRITPTRCGLPCWMKCLAVCVGAAEASSHHVSIPAKCGAEPLGLCLCVRGRLRACVRMGVCLVTLMRAPPPLHNPHRCRCLHQFTTLCAVRVVGLLCVCAGRVCNQSWPRHRRVPAPLTPLRRTTPI
jgi:hypothetical protein